LFLESQSDIRVVARAESASAAVSAIQGLPRKSKLICLVALEIEGRDRDALWLIRTIRERFPTVVILACSNKADLSKVSRALFMGADGFVNKRTDPVEFLDSIRRAANGEMTLTGLPPDWFGSIVDEIARQTDDSPLLSDRELEVLGVSAEGLTARGIAERLGLRERTVTTHLSNIYKKLGVKSRSEAVAAGVRQGLLELATDHH